MATAEAIHSSQVEDDQSSALTDNQSAAVPRDQNDESAQALLNMAGFTIGYNPFRWRARARAYIDDSDAEIARLLSTFQDGLIALEPSERAKVEISIRHATKAGRELAASNWRWSTANTALFATASIGGALVLLSTGQPLAHHSWNLVGALVAIALLIVFLIGLGSMLARALLPTGSIRAFWIYIMIVEATQIAVIEVSTRAPAAPSWLSRGSVHMGIVVSASTIAYWAFLGLFVGNAVRTLNWTLHSRRDRQHAEVRLLNVMLLNAQSPPNKHLLMTGDALRRFTRDWPRIYMTGLPHVDNRLKTWAAKVAMAVEDSVLLGAVGRLRDPKGAYFRVAVKVILRQEIEESEEGPYGSSNSWQRVGRMLLATLLLAASATLFLIALWQPFVPHLLISWWGLNDLASAVEGQLRPGAFAAGVAAFSSFAHLANQAPLSPFALPVGRRRS